MWTVAAGGRVLREASSYRRRWFSALSVAFWVRRISISDIYYAWLLGGSCREEYLLAAIRAGTGSALWLLILGSMRAVSLVEMPCTDADLLINLI